jgi:hypothetical protein
MNGVQPILVAMTKTAGSRDAVPPTTRPQGFILPESIPPLLGVSSLSRISTAFELYNVIFTSMPWWNPGSLTSEDAWAISAYLLRARGELPDCVTLTAANAPIYRLHTPAPSLVDERPGVIGLALSFLVAMIALIFKKAKTLWYLSSPFTPAVGRATSNP